MRPTIFISLMSGLLACAACSSDAEPDEDWCLDPSYLVPLDVSVHVDRAFSDFRTVDSVFATRSAADCPYLRYFAAAYPSNPGLPVVVASSVDTVVPMRIHPGKYTLVGWASYETASEKTRGMYFYTDDFGELLLRNKYSYTGANPYKLAFRGEAERNIAHNTSATGVTATPAMAMYRIVATDSAAFTPAKVVVQYSSILPSAVNGRTGRINWWWSGMEYSCVPDGATLASDYVLAADSETSVTVTVEMYDADGSLCARKKDVEIPLVNGGVTTVRANFLSVRELDNSVSPGGGISINTEWDATFEIEI